MKTLRLLSLIFAILDLIIAISSQNWLAVGGWLFAIIYVFPIVIQEQESI